MDTTLLPIPEGAKVITCPRRAGIFRYEGRQNEDFIRPDDNTCSFCGSLDPDVLMARIEAGTIHLDGTDKSYKAYLNPIGDEPLLQTTRTDKDSNGDRSKWTWETKPVDFGTFYFQHLSREQMVRFIDLWNDRKIRHSVYVRPFFMQPKAV